MQSCWHLCDLQHYHNWHYMRINRPASWRSEHYSIDRYWECIWRTRSIASNGQKDDAVSIYYEFAIGLLIILSVFCCIYMCCTGELDCTDCSYKALRPFVLFDCIVIILLGPFGNVYLFLLGCVDAYVKILLRIGFYLSTISLPAAFSYIGRQKDNPDPNADSFKSFLPILLSLALKLASCSSCLATFIDIAYPEALAVRFTYLAFTIIGVPFVDDLQCSCIREFHLWTCIISSVAVTRTLPAPL